VVERSFSWMARFRRLARDDERLPETLVGCIIWPLPSSCSLPLSIASFMLKL
ncbi:MAG: IS5/IS1182 family transposase, partial [Chloroflexota bacterium]